jgi:mRNA-degrading endonuclease RelE of RelBE toxin-antitoxin system
MKRVPVTLVEMPEFVKFSKQYLDGEERSELLYYLGSNPDGGEVMEGTGGVRKLRWAAGGRGKSAGYRIVYYFHNETMPVFVLTMYPKNVKDNLSKAQRNDLKKAMPILVKEYRAGLWKKKGK